MKALHKAKCQATNVVAQVPFSLNRSGEAMENMGTLGSSLNEERRNVFSVREHLGDMEKMLRAMPEDRHKRSASEDGDVMSASKATKKDVRNDEDVTKIAIRVHDMLEDHIMRTQIELTKTVHALKKERERVDKATGGGWELLQKAQESKLKVEAQLAEEREGRHKDTLTHLQVLSMA
jgi:hypothetical protein